MSLNLDAGCGGNKYFKNFTFESHPKLINSNIKIDIEIPKVKDLFIRASVTNLPFKSKVFDMVICSHVLEHLPKAELAYQAINDIKRVSNKHLIFVPTFFMAQYDKDINGIGHKLSYVGRRFIKSKFANLLARLGDKIMSNIYVRYGIRIIEKRLHIFAWETKVRI